MVRSSAVAFSIVILPSDDVESVLNAAFEFVDDVFGRAAQQERHAVGVVALDVEQAGLGVTADPTGAEVGVGRGVEVGDDLGTEDLLEEAHVGLLRPADRQDTLLGQQILGEVVDALLTEHHVGARRDDLIDLLAELFLLAVEELLELVGVVDVDRGVRVGLLDLDGVVQQEDVRRIELDGHVVVDGVLVDDRAVEEFGLRGGLAGLGLDLDELQVDDVGAVVGLDGDGPDRVDDELCQ